MKISPDPIGETQIALVESFIYGFTTWRTEVWRNMKEAICPSRILIADVTSPPEVPESG
jgi:hypothetical protein